MRSFNLKSIAVAGALVFAASAAIAANWTANSDQSPVPLNTAGNSELKTQSLAVSGGTLYSTVLRQPGTSGVPIAVAQTFVPTSATSPLRYLALTDGKSDAGVPMTAAAGTPVGTMGVSRTAGTNLSLVGEATSSSAKTNKVMFEFNLPDSYVAGANIPVVVNAIVTGTGTLTGASTTITTAMYTEIGGVEAALPISAAQQFDKTGEVLTYTVTGTGLVAGQHVVVELTVLVTSASGANTGQVNSVAVQG